MKSNSKKGSALVGAIFIALILAISGATYLWVIRNSGTLEKNAHQDIQALYAAESVLQLATRALAQIGLPTGTIWIVPPTARIKVNNLWVDVEAKDYSSTPGALKDKILSARAYDAQTGGSFIKKVSWRAAELSGFEYGFFVNSVKSNGNKEFCGQQLFGDTYLTSKQGSGGKMNLVCAGPSQECNTFYGSLSIVAAEVNEHKCPLDSTTIQNDSTPLYKLLQASVVVPPSYTNLGDSLRHLSADTLHLASPGDLVFLSDGTATFNGTSIGNINNKVLIASGAVNVKGTVKGNATLVSGARAKITITDTLVYQDFNPHTGNAPPLPPTAINATNPNYLGLVTDGGIVFANTKPIHVNAAIVSWNPDPKGSVAELEMTVNANSENNRVTLTGTVLLAQMEKDFSPFTFVQDRRLLTRQPIGFPPTNKVGNLFKLEISNWEESSTF